MSTNYFVQNMKARVDLIHQRVKRLSEASDGERIRCKVLRTGELISLKSRSLLQFETVEEADEFEISSATEGCVQNAIHEALRQEKEWLRRNPKEVARRHEEEVRPVIEQKEREEARRQLTERIDQVKYAEEKLGSHMFLQWASDFRTLHHPASVHHPPTPTQVAAACRDLRQRVVMTMFRRFVDFRLYFMQHVPACNWYTDFNFEFESREEDDDAMRIKIAAEEEAGTGGGGRRAVVAENGDYGADLGPDDDEDVYVSDFETFATTIDGATVDVIDHAKSLRTAFFALKRFKDERVLAPGSNNREMLRAKEEFEKTLWQLCTFVR